MSLFAQPLDDQHFALCTLQLLTRASSAQPSVYFTIDGVPVPKARARHGSNGHVFTPAKTRDAEKDLAWVFKSHIRNGPWNGPIALVAMFYLPDQRRVDGDNLLKLLKDAATKAKVWHDDSQVVAHAVAVGLDAQRPRTVVALAPAVSELRRTAPVAKGASR